MIRRGGAAVCTDTPTAMTKPPTKRDNGHHGRKMRYAVRRRQPQEMRRSSSWRSIWVAAIWSARPRPNPMSSDRWKRQRKTSEASPMLCPLSVSATLIVFLGSQEVPVDRMWKAVRICRKVRPNFQPSCCGRVSLWKARRGDVLPSGSSLGPLRRPRFLTGKRQDAEPRLESGVRGKAGDGNRTHVTSSEGDSTASGSRMPAPAATGALGTLVSHGHARRRGDYSSTFLSRSRCMARSRR